MPLVAELSPKEGRELSSAQVLAHHCWQPPVLSRGLLYVMSYDHRAGKAKLLCLDVREKK